MINETDADQAGSVVNGAGQRQPWTLGCATGHDDVFSAEDFSLPLAKIENLDADRLGTLNDYSVDQVF